MERPDRAPMADRAPGSFDCRREVALVMSAAIKKSRFDRIDIAGRMTRFLGEEITLSMLNAWTAKSRDEHVINFLRPIAFEQPTEQNALAILFAAKLTAQILYRNSALLSQCVRSEREPS